MRRLRMSILMLAAAALTGCAAAPGPQAPAAEVAARAWAEPGPARLTLITAINNRSGSGGHSALLVSASQRVLFDPAGSWRHPTAPEQGDVIYGMTPTMLDFYIDYHARPTFHIVTQEIVVTEAVAERALALVRAHGPAPKATCGQSVSGILREVGFSQIDRSWYPERIMRDFDAVPGVTRREVFDATEDAHSPERPRIARVTDDGLVFEGG